MIDIYNQQFDFELCTYETLRMDSIKIVVNKNVGEWKLCDMPFILRVTELSVSMQAFIETNMHVIERLTHKILREDCNITHAEVLRIFDLIFHEKYGMLLVINKMRESGLKQKMKQEVIVTLVKVVKNVMEFRKWLLDYNAQFQPGAGEDIRVRQYKDYFYMFCGNVDRAKFFVPYLRTPRRVTGNLFSALTCVIKVLFEFQNFDLGMTILERMVDEEVKDYDDLAKCGLKIFIE